MEQYKAEQHKRGPHDGLTTNARPSAPSIWALSLLLAPSLAPSFIVIFLIPAFPHGLGLSFSPWVLRSRPETLIIYGRNLAALHT